MKFFTILHKNLRSVSRNWNYFAVLIVCPILLILVAGAMLNSVDYNNLRVGIVNQDPSNNLTFASLRHLSTYPALEPCLYDLTNAYVSICIVLNQSEGTHFFSVYVDNTNPKITVYAHQFILEKAFQQQTSYIERISEDVRSKLVLFSMSLNDSRKELNNAYAQLDSQEQDLIQYQKNITSIRQEFNRSYVPIKTAYLLLEQQSFLLDQSTASLHGNISLFRKEKAAIEGNISFLNDSLAKVLPPADYLPITLTLSSLTNQLDAIDNNLASIEQVTNLYNRSALLDPLNQTINELDMIRDLLDRSDRDISNLIVKTEESKTKILSFIAKVNEGQGEIETFSQQMDSKGMIVQFLNAFNLSSNPVFLAYPLLIAIIITFTSLVLSNMFILKQVNQPSYIRDLITPTNDFYFFLADYLINLFFVCLQAIALLALGMFWFHFNSLDQLFFISLSIFLSSSFFIFIGMSLGYLIRSQALSMLLSVFFVIFLFIFSDLLAPSAVVGDIMRSFIDLNPFIIITQLLIGSLHLNKSFGGLSSLFMKLFILYCVGFLIAYLAKKLNRFQMMR